RKYGAATPEGGVAVTPQEAAEVARRLGGRVVVKAQVHVGGRGKAGGIKLADGPDEAREVAADIIGMRLVSHQTAPGSQGVLVEKVLVEKALDISQEYYLGIVVDRAQRLNAVMVSARGGVDIEEVAATEPEAIAKAWIDPGIGLADYQMRRLCYEAGLDRGAVRGATRFLRCLYDAYIGVDANLAEINPLVVTNDGEVLAADAKMNLDDSALFRHEDLAQLAEEGEEDEIEAEAHRRGIQYVRLDGDIGIIGNGAGLVMSTLDEVKRAGGAPANFLDVGGAADVDVVKNSLEVLMMNPNVRGIFFNVFGGIVRCDVVAKGILQAKQELNITVPFVLRLTGTNEAEGRALLEGSDIVYAPSMEAGAAKIVQLTK
ncbi:MAG: ADP-forming succinate--CoA ligase subunit beta, partial [Armatimonadota bacterium]